MKKLLYTLSLLFALTACGSDIEELEEMAQQENQEVKDKENEPGLPGNVGDWNEDPNDYTTGLRPE